MVRIRFTPQQKRLFIVFFNLICAILRPYRRKLSPVLGDPGAFFDFFADLSRSADRCSFVIVPHEVVMFIFQAGKKFEDIIAHVQEDQLPQSVREQLAVARSVFLQVRLLYDREMKRLEDISEKQFRRRLDKALKKLSSIKHGKGSFEEKWARAYRTLMSVEQ